MSGNTFGELFTLTSCGESHGPAYVGIIDGCPPGLALTESDIQRELDRRKPGKSRFTSQRRERDIVQITSGVFEGVTTGTPIGLLIANHDARASDYDAIKNKFRPGHADCSYFQKYGIRDYRGGGRASARETVLRVAAAAIAKKYLFEHYAMTIKGYLAQMGDIRLDVVDLAAADHNPFFSPDAKRLGELEDYVDALRKAGDSIGAKIIVRAENVPPGLGEPIFDRLDADLARALMSIPAVKAVEIGDGMAVIEQKGSAHRDEIVPEGFLSNHAGGILGGISTGQTIIAGIAIKPASSIVLPARTITTEGEATRIQTTGRHDPCVGIRAVPVAEAMVALVLMDHVLRQRAYSKE